MFSENQLDFGMVGTWELRNAITNGGVKSIFTVPDVVDGVKYLQSPGSWSWGIVKNKINSEANDERKRHLLISYYRSIHQMLHTNTSYQTLKFRSLNLFKTRLEVQSKQVVNLIIKN